MKRLFLVRRGRAGRAVAQLPAQRALLWMAIIALLLGACSSSPTARGLPSATPFPTDTPIPTFTPTASVTPTPTVTPTWTPTGTPTRIPTATATQVPAGAGTPLPGTGGPINEANMRSLRILAEWGLGRVETLAWSPDGSRIAVATPLGVYIYDAATLAAPLLLRTGAPAYRLAWSPDGARLAVDVGDPGAGYDNAVPPHRIQIWEAASAKPLALLESGGMALVMIFSGADELSVLARAQGGADFQRWNLPGLRQTQVLHLTGGEDAVEGTLSADLSMAATRGNAPAASSSAGAANSPDAAGSQGPVRVWRLSDGANIAVTKDNRFAAGVLAFSPDGSLLAVTYPDITRDYANFNFIRVWRVPAGGGDLGEPAYTLSDAVRTEGSFEAYISLAWSPDGQYLAAGTSDQVIHVWKAEPSPVYRRISAATLPRALAFDPQSGGPDATLAAGGLEVWRTGKPEQVAYTDDFLPGLYDMQFVPAGSGLPAESGPVLALAEYGAIDFRSTASGSRVFNITGMDGPVHSLAFSSKGNFLVAACQDGTTRLYRTRDGRYLDQLGNPTWPLLAAAFSTNDFWIASAGEDMKIRIFRLDDGLQIDSITEPFVAYQLAFSPNNDQLASLTTSGVNLREVGGTERQTEFLLQGNVGGVGLTNMAYSPGQEHLALVGSSVVRVVDPVSRIDQYAIYEPGSAQPWSVAFSPDNAFLAVGWSNGQIGLYWAADGTRMHSWQAHPESVQRLAFSRDGVLLASLGGEGTIRIWGTAK